MTKRYTTEIDNKITYHRFNIINNNPRIHSHYNNPAFNCAYCKDTKDVRVIEYLDNLPTMTDYDSMSNKDFAFRPNDRPKVETLFSSKVSRDRYEKIILDKGLDILEKVGDHGKSTRPLGFVNPTYQTLGMGSFVFTWRNISNTCPIVFWWEPNGWKPLFYVANRGL